MGPLTNTYGNNPSAWTLLPLDKICIDGGGKEMGCELFGIRFVSCTPFWTPFWDH